jgi:hypothetical protein
MPNDLFQYGFPLTDEKNFLEDEEESEDETESDEDGEEDEEL